MAIWIPAAHHWNGREGQMPHYIIIHGTAGGSSAQAIGNYFADPNTQASTHYVIGQDGTVVQCVDEHDAAWANGGFSAGHDPWWNTSINPNLTTIAIEHVKPHIDNSDVLTNAQKQASFALVQDICTRWGIPRRRADALGGITGHYSIDPVNRSRCPGPYPWDELFTFLTTTSSSQGDTMLEITDPFAAAFFELTADGQWRCKTNGFLIRGEILHFYRQSNGALRLPISNEIRLDPAYSGTVQHFEGGTIAYDPEHRWDQGTTNCYVVHADWSQYSGLVPKTQLDQAQANLQKAQQQASDEQNTITTLQAQVSSLQAQLKALQSTQPIDQAGLKAALTSADAAIQAALGKL